MRIRAGILVALVVLVSCARSEEAPGQGTPSPSPSPRELSGLARPEMFAAGQGTVLGGELVIPDFCRPRAAGLSHHQEGFLLVVEMEDDVPALNRPPALSFGVLLFNIEVRVGVFAPREGRDLGGGYLYTRQYQIPDRPKLQVDRFRSGKFEPVELVDDDVDANEIRVAFPSVGPDTDDASRWAVRVTCVLHHPVEGFYFPSTRIPGAAPAKFAISD